MKYGTELQESILFVDMCHNHPNYKYRQILKEYLIHIPNEGKRSFKIGKDLKRQGLKKGVSDYFLAYPIISYKSQKSGLWIELKRHTLSKITAEQLRWLTIMQDIGYAAHVAYGADHAYNLITDYLNAHFS